MLFVILFLFVIVNNMDDLFNLQFVICSGVKWIILFMFINKFLGVDKVSMRVNKDSFLVIFGLFIDIINCLFIIFKFLDLWKVIEVIFLLKEGDYEILFNKR